MKPYDGNWRRHAMNASDRELFIVIPLAMVFVIIGIGLLYWGTYIYNDINSIRERGIKVKGLILRYERRGPGSSTKVSDIITVPIVQFKTKSGESVIVEGNVDDIAILKNICKSGGNIEVIYDPDKPEHAVINTFAELWFAPLIMWIVGSGFVLGPPFTIWRHYRR
jgi:hypothetical protein